MTLTRGYLGRHFQGKKGGFHPAMLDVAQDHLLAYLHAQGLFDLGLVFKGGTSLRKMRAGAAGRFSTDLDFCVTDVAVRSLVMDVVDGLEVPPFTFTLTDRDDDTGRAALHVTGPFGPQPADTGRTAVQIPSKVEMSPKPPWLPPQNLPFLPLPVHSSYDLPEGLPALPVVRAEEAISEKLARYARVGLARDLYDLVWYGNQGAIDEPFIRRLWLLKVYQDVVIDDRWSRTFEPSAILEPRDEKDIDHESIGFLTSPVNIPKWEQQFRQRYAFLADLDENDRKWAATNAGDQYEFTQAVAAFAAQEVPAND